ncbi:MAG: hypothetical protein MZU97_26250 [Bacillus subtilis]|nr:hypothetical protein [Bacillus subtilis]
MEYGFMCYDFTSSTTALTGGQNDVKAILPPLTTTPVSNGAFIHYVENTRVVKGDGLGHLEQRYRGRACWCVPSA